MSLIDQLLEAAAGANLDDANKRQNSLQQHFLNLRAQAAIAGIVDMKKAVEEEQQRAAESKGK